MSTAAIPSISSAWAVGNVKEAKAHMKSGISVTMLILIPAAAGMTVLAYPIIGLLFPQKDTLMMATQLLSFGTPAIVLFGLSTLTNGILQAIGEVNAPLKNASRALVIYAVVLTLILLVSHTGVYALVFGNCLYPLLVCYLNQRSLKQKTGYRQEIKRTYIIPLIASLIMVVFVVLTYYGLFALTHQVFIPLALAIVAGIVVYFAVIIYIYWDHPQQLYSIPYMKTVFTKLKKRFK